jgi:hypothetical protein
LQSLPVKKEHYLALEELNDFLIERIQFHLPSIKIIPENKILEFKEAVIFALGVLKLRGQINVLSSVTGAKKITVAGYLQTKIISQHTIHYTIFYICQKNISQ